MRTRSHLYTHASYSFAFSVHVDPCYTDYSSFSMLVNVLVNLVNARLRFGGRMLSVIEAMLRRSKFNIDCSIGEVSVN